VGGLPRPGRAAAQADTILLTDDYASLSRRAQLSRLRRLALDACRRYGLGVCRMEAVSHSFNTTFRVHGSLPPDVGVRCYALRIHRPGYQDPVAIRSEVEWLQAIRRQSDLAVPEPIPAADGSLVVFAGGPGIPTERPCVLFRWVEGRFAHRPLGPERLEEVGRFTARLHRLSVEFRPPPGFLRKRWDLHGLRGAAVGGSMDHALAALAEPHRQLLWAAEASVARGLEALEGQPGGWGLIHSDLYRGNLLFENGEVRAIDFDGCGWGPYLYDAAVALTESRARPGYGLRRQAFLAGYRGLRPLPEEIVAWLDHLIAGRLLVHAVWFASHLEEPDCRAQAASFLPRHFGALRTVLGALGAEPHG
jgi:Ser/Thr protein kinase RdoA (MazF antagonist)